MLVYYPIEPYTDTVIISGPAMRDRFAIALTGPEPDFFGDSGGLSEQDKAKGRRSARQDATGCVF
jgi:hypothetical protein